MAAPLLRKVCALCRFHRVGLPTGRRKPDAFLTADALVLGTARRAANALSNTLVFSARTGRDLPHRVRFVVDANQRTDRTQWHFADRPVHDDSAATMRLARHRLGTISLVADVVLDQSVRWLSPFS